MTPRKTVSVNLSARHLQNEHTISIIRCRTATDDRTPPEGTLQSAPRESPRRHTEFPARNGSEPAGAFADKRCHREGRTDAACPTPSRPSEDSFDTYHSILVPLDGSKFAEQAIPLALSIASRARASLEIMRVHDLYLFQDPHGCWSRFNAQEDAAYKEREQAYLDAIAKRLGTTAAVPLTSALVDGLVDEGIVKHARTKPFDLIVMAVHDRSPLSCFWMGSRADELVRHAFSPILLMRPRDGFHDTEPDPTPKRILIPLDGSSLAERVLEPAVALGKIVEATYSLVRVIESSATPIGFPFARGLNRVERCWLAKQIAESDAYLKEVAQELETKGLHVETHVVVGKSAAVAILDLARERKHDLIAIATHGRNGLQRFLLGSVADKIVRGTFKPVLVYRPSRNNN